MNKPLIISGEASETDSEEDVVLDKPQLLTQSIQGAVVYGEDSESETENEGSICSAVSALNQSHELDESKTDESSKHTSLFHMKLKESNQKLHSNIENCCQSLVDEASRTLNNVDQRLLRSQVTLQSAVTSLKSLGQNSTVLKNKLQSLLSANFIPNINTDK